MVFPGNETVRLRTYGTQYSHVLFFYQQVVPNGQGVAKDGIHFGL